MEVSVKRKLMGILNVGPVAEIISKETAINGRTCNKKANKRKNINIDVNHKTSVSILQQQVVSFDNAVSIGNIPKIKVHVACGNRLSTFQIEAMLDTGASVSCMTQKLYEKLFHEIGLQKTNKIRPNPTAANAKEIFTLNETIADLVIMNETVRLRLNKVRFSVFPRLNTALIIGMDVFKNLDLVILREGAHAVKIGGHVFPTINDSSGINCVDQTINIGGSNLTLTQINISKDIFKPHFGPKLPQALTITDSNDGTLSFFDDHLFNIQSGELKADLNIALIHDPSSNVHLCNLNNSRKLNLTEVELIKSGQWNLKGICSSDNVERRKFIPTCFSKTLVQKSELSLTGKQSLETILQKFRHIFSNGSETDIGTYKYETVIVKLKNPSESPPYVKPRPIPIVAREFVKNKLNDLVSADIFEESPLGSHFNAPVHIIKKKPTFEGEEPRFRLCVDYSISNKYLEHNTFPIPSIRTIIDELSGAKLFSSLDLRSGF